MSSVVPVLSALTARFPMAILSVEWNDPSLIIGGVGWSLAVTSPWRIVTTERLILGSDDATQDSVSAILHDKMVVNCEIQSRHASLDLALVLDSEEVLELFSVAYLEPWTLSLADTGMFVASPSE